jgi:hypothetical protein
MRRLLICSTIAAVLFTISPFGARAQKWYNRSTGPGGGLSTGPGGGLSTGPGGALSSGPCGGLSTGPACKLEK